MTGWIKLTRWSPDALLESDLDPIYVNVEQIQAVYEEVVGDEGDIVTVIDMLTGEFKVSEDAKEVLQKIRLSRPVRT